jgi:hypothetical protein
MYWALQRLKKKGREKGSDNGAFLTNTLWTKAAYRAIQALQTASDDKNLVICVLMNGFLLTDGHVVMWTP